MSKVKEHYMVLSERIVALVQKRFGCDGDTLSDLTDEVFALLTSSSTKKALPSDAKMLEANKKYVAANKFKKNTFDDLDHAYYHGQVDFIQDYCS